MRPREVLLRRRGGASPSPLCAPQTDRKTDRQTDNREQTDWAGLHCSASHGFSQKTTGTTRPLRHQKIITTRSKSTPVEAQIRSSCPPACTTRSGSALASCRQTPPRAAVAGLQRRPAWASKGFSRESGLERIGAEMAPEDAERSESPTSHPEPAHASATKTLDGISTSPLVRFAPSLYFTRCRTVELTALAALPRRPSWPMSSSSTRLGSGCVALHASWGLPRKSWFWPPRTNACSKQRLAAPPAAAGTAVHYRAAPAGFLYACGHAGRALRGDVLASTPRGAAEV